MSPQQQGSVYVCSTHCDLKPPSYKMSYKIQVIAPFNLLQAFKTRVMP